MGAQLDVASRDVVLAFMGSQSVPATQQVLNMLINSYRDYALFPSSRTQSAHSLPFHR